MTGFLGYFFYHLERLLQKLYLLPCKITIIEQVPVGIHRDIYRRMPQLALDVFYILPRLNPYTGIRMPQ